MDIPAQPNPQTPSNDEMIELVRSRDRFASLFHLSQYKAKDQQDFLDYALNEIISLTKSKIGYIYFYSEEKKEFVLNTWSKDVMKQCTITNPQTIYQLEKTGIWGEAVRQRKPIVLNNFSAPHPLKKGYPEGHAPLQKFMTVPVFDKEKIVAVVGLANKETDYDAYDIEQVTMFMDSVWKIATIMRADTEKKKIEESLRINEEKYRTILDTALDAMVVTNNQDQIELWNKAAVSMFGYTKEEMLGKTLHEIVPAMSEHRTKKDRLHAFQQTGKSDVIGKAIALPVRKKDGTTFTIELTIGGMQLLGKWYAVGVMRDITERKEIELELKEKVDELEKMNSLMVGRELTMVKLKEKLREAHISIDDV